MLCINFSAFRPFILDMLTVMWTFSSLALWREKVHFVISDHNKMEVDPALFDEYDDLEMLEAEAFRDQLPQHQRRRREKVCRQRINMDFPVVEEFR